MRDKDVDWDDYKAECNIKKHGLSFDEAQKVFSDPNAIEICDEKNSTIDEERYIVIGRVNDKMVVNVVYTDRNGKRRIITARLAVKNEWRMYFAKLRTNA